MRRAPFNRESQRIVDEIVRVFERFNPPLTVRQVYYQLATVGLVPLSHAGYRQAQRLLVKVREQGIVPWDSFADRTREVIRPYAYRDVHDMAEEMCSVYRRDMWRTQPAHVEVWLEKDALSGFFQEITLKWGVPLYVARGFSSVTFVMEAAKALAEIDKPKHVYFFGDHDPAGLGIEADVRDKLARRGADFQFHRVAVTLDDIQRFNLRPLEAKSTDSRFKSYAAKHGTQAIELDALPPDELRRRIEDSIKRHVDLDEWNRLLHVERIERQQIRDVWSAIGGIE